MLDLDKLTVSNNTAFRLLVGHHVNPYQTVFLPQLPSKHQDRKQTLKEPEAKLDARLVEQDRYFANPKNKAKWGKERQDNLVNERFCW